MIGLMHEAPYWTARRVRRMARTACVTMGGLTASLASGIAAGVATGKHGTSVPAC